MLRKFSAVILSVATFLMISTTAFSQGISIIPHGGLSKDMRSQTANYWETGFNIGAYLFISVPGPLSFGGKVTYHSWSVDGDGWMKDFFPTSPTYRLDKSSGSQSVIEIMPALRYTLSPPLVPVKFSLQGAAGLLIVTASDVVVRGSYSTSNSSGSREQTIGGQTLTGFGLQVGPVISIASLIEILPMYTVYSAGGDLYNHYAIDIGITLGK